MSTNIIPKSLDRAMDKANPVAASAAPGISIRNGPVDEMDVDEPRTNGNAGKRKARSGLPNGRSYNEASEEEEEDGEEPPIVSQ